MQHNMSQDRINLWIVWVLASMAGILLGFALSYLVVAVAKLFFSGVNEDRLFGGVMWMALALMLTTMQWLVLRRNFTESGWWFAATMAGWLGSLVSVFVIGKLLTDRLGFAIQPSFVERTILVAYVGCIVGVAQWIYFRRQLEAAGFWILGSVVGYALLSLAIGKSITNLTEMVLVGAIPGAVTGVVLVLLHRCEGRGVSPGIELAA